MSKGRDPLKDALYNHLYGTTEIENITPLFEEAARIKEAKKEAARLIAKLEKESCSEACESICQAAEQMAPQRPAEKPKVVDVVAKFGNVVCARCRYYSNKFGFGMDEFGTDGRCYATAENRIDPISGRNFVEGVRFCASRNMNGNCNLSEEFPEQEVEATTLEEFLYNMRLLKLVWDAETQCWKKKIGWRKD